MTGLPTRNTTHKENDVNVSDGKTAFPDSRANGKTEWRAARDKYLREVNEHRVVDEVQRVSLREEPDGVYVRFSMPNQTWLIGRFPSLAAARQVLGEAIEPVEDLWAKDAQDYQAELGNGDDGRMPRDTPEVEAWTRGEK